VGPRLFPILRRVLHGLRRKREGACTFCILALLISLAFRFTKGDREDAASPPRSANPD
jgi:hypothetical protein